MKFFKTVFVFLSIVFSINLYAAPLTPAQDVILRADIIADPVLGILPPSSNAIDAIILAYRVTSVPDFWIWRNAVPKEELMNATSQDATVFTWAGNGFILRSPGELTAWREIFGSNGTVDTSQSNVRLAFQDIFSGAGNAALNRAHLISVARRKANRLEKLFAVGTGSIAVPGTALVYGPLNYQQILILMGW